VSGRRAKKKRRAHPASRQARPSPRQPRPRREPHWLVVIALTAIFSAVATAFSTGAITPGDVKSVLHTIESPFESTSPESEGNRIVDTLVSETKVAQFWRGPPVIYQESVRYMRKHFADFNPLKFRQFADIQPHVRPADLLTTTPLWIGREIVTAGVVIHENVVSPSRPLVDWLIEFVDPHTTTNKHVDGVILCRISLPPNLPPPPVGLGVAVRGVVLASGIGSAKQVAATYLIGSSIVPVAPKGTKGGIPIPGDLS
jgi:hypothetical protein